MFEWLFGKRGVEVLKKDTKEGFEAVKKDINSVTGWIKHLDSERNSHENSINELREEITTLKSEIDGLKSVFAIMNDMKPKIAVQTPKQVFNKQTDVYNVQTPVQTGVQTPNLDQFSVTEKAILWILINNEEMKFSYEDLATMMGKNKSTIRGQINAIKSKSESLIVEQIEQNGKKRVYIPEEIKERLLKNSKVRVSTVKKTKKKEKND